MPDTGNPQPLDYRVLPKDRRRYVEDAEERKWRYFRVLFRICLVLLVAPIAIHFARNYFLFGGMVGLTPADFVPYVQQQGVPVVEAFKRYQRDKGPLQALNTNGLIDEKYLPDSKYDYGFFPYPYTKLEMIHFGHYVYYDFTPGAEHWEVRGAVANGIIPVPPVVLPPTQPATQP